MTLKVCPNLLSQGACATEGCTFKHDVHLCQTCRVVCISVYFLETHLSGKKHARRVRAQACPHPSFCKLCNVSLGSGWSYPQHIRGRAHQALLEEQQDSQDDSSSDTVSQFETVPREHSQCHVCDLTVPERLWSSHVAGFNHRKKERFASIQAAFDEANKDKHGITVSPEHGGEGPLDFGFIELATLQAQPTRSTQVTLHLTTPAIIEVTQIRLSSTMANRPRATKCVDISTKDTDTTDTSSSFSLEDITPPKRLRFQSPFDFSVKFNPCGLPGRSNDRLEIVFLDSALQTQFVITRPLIAVVGVKADLELVKPSAPYNPRKRNEQEPEKEVIPGIKPQQLANIKWVVALPEAPIPKSLEAVLRNSKGNIVSQTLGKTWLPGTLNSETYGRHFKVLLHVEEAQMK